MRLGASLLNVENTCMQDEAHLAVSALNVKHYIQVKSDP